MLTPEDIYYIASLDADRSGMQAAMNAGQQAVGTLTHGMPWPPTEAEFAAMGCPAEGTRERRFWRFGFEAGRDARFGHQCFPCSLGDAPHGRMRLRLRDEA